MNNTKKRTLSLVAVLLAATLVVGVGSFAATTTKTAFAASGNNSDNTVTAQINGQGASQSGFDNVQEQEDQNTICTHPGENASCVSEAAAAAAAAQTPPVKLTCEQCFTKFLRSTQISRVLDALSEHDVTTLGQLCAALPTLTTEAGFVDFLENIGISEPVAKQLIQCLKDAGIVFPTEGG